MPAVIIDKVSVSSANVNLTCKTDLDDTATDGKVVFDVSVNRHKLADWLEDNPDKNAMDYVKQEVQQTYNWYKRTLEKARVLVGKTLTW